MTGKTTTLYLDEDDLNTLEAKLPGRSLSALVKQAIKAYIQGYADIEIGVKLIIMENEIITIDEQVNNLNRQLNTLNTRKTYLMRDRDTLHKQHDVIVRTSRLDMLMKTLNKVCNNTRCDYELVLQNVGEIEKEIKELNPNFDLKSYVDRVKAIMDY